MKRCQTQLLNGRSAVSALTEAVGPRIRAALTGGEMGGDDCQERSQELRPWPRPRSHQRTGRLSPEIWSTLDSRFALGVAVSGRLWQGEAESCQSPTTFSITSSELALGSWYAINFMPREGRWQGKTEAAPRKRAESDGNAFSAEPVVDSDMDVLGGGKHHLDRDAHIWLRRVKQRVRLVETARPRGC